MSFDVIPGKIKSSILIFWTCQALAPFASQKKRKTNKTLTHKEITAARANKQHRMYTSTCYGQYNIWGHVQQSLARDH